jgi:hypothetical protein
MASLEPNMKCAAAHSPQYDDTGDDGSPVVTGVQRSMNVPGKHDFHVQSAHFESNWWLRAVPVDPHEAEVRSGVGTLVDAVAVSRPLGGGIFRPILELLGDGLVEATGGHVMERVGSSVGGIEQGEFRKVPVTADDYDALGCGAAEESKEMGALFGEIRPLFRSMLGWDEGNARNHRPDFGEFAQTALEPCPLFVTEQGRAEDTAGRW